jgi:Methylamine utilization protein MauJ
MRYDVAVQTNLSFHTKAHPGPLQDLPHRPETVAIEFEGRRFLWHAVPPLRVDFLPQGRLRRARELAANALRRVAGSIDRPVWQERYPTVSTPITDANDYEAERLAMARFLSALAYETRRPIEVETGGAAGVPAEFDPPVATAVRSGLVTHPHEAPAEVVVVNDDRLRLVLGYYREGLGTESPYFKFLAYWNALEVACDDLGAGASTWVRTTMQKAPGLARSTSAPPGDWWTHLKDGRRHAVAHATRDPKYGVPDLDTDDPATRASYYGDAGTLDDLVRLRVHERWGQWAVSFRRHRT